MGRNEVKSNAKGLTVGTGELRVMTLINMFFFACFMTKYAFINMNYVT